MHKLTHGSAHVRMEVSMNILDDLTVQSTAVLGVSGHTEEVSATHIQTATDSLNVRKISHVKNFP